MTIFSFIDSALGTLPADFQFIKYIAGAVMLVVICSLILNFFLGAISGITIKFFK